MCVFFVESCSGSLQSPPDLDHQIVTLWIILPLENPFSVPVFDAPLLPRGQAVPPLVGSGRESALPAPTAAQDPLGCRPSSPKICLGCDHGQLQPSPSPIHFPFGLVGWLFRFCILPGQVRRRKKSGAIHCRQCAFEAFTMGICAVGR